MLLSGKSVREVSTRFGVSEKTIYGYFPGGVERLRQIYPNEAVKVTTMRKRVNAAQHKSGGGLGRPRTVTEGQIKAMVIMQASGKTVKDIANKIGVTQASFTAT